MLYNQARTPYFTGAQHIKEVRNMKIKLKKRGNTYTFTVKNGGVTDFLFGFSDLSAFGNPTKKPEKIRGNFRKCNKILLNHDLNELSIALSTGDYFEIAPPVFSRGRTEKDIEEYCGMYEKGSVKPELPHLELQITVPPGNGIKVYSINSGYWTHLINQAGAFYETNDIAAIEEATGAYF